MVHRQDSQLMTHGWSNDSLLLERFMSLADPELAEVFSAQV